ncbi:MAG: twin-arginine translocase TatA/TatE family subunit [Gemmatimonadetes bacterium]|nr:twin-arginine translocase TatA/TatE family subunit [Gemmatimonadota bacterium]MCK5482887.1 twin-arginine translocase TatA/TatE family subunit [Gemmatimonadota bacterium]
MGLGSIGISELVVIFTIVLVFFGPKRFPEIARSMGSAMREFRRSLNQIQRELEEVDPTRDLPGRDLLKDIRAGKPGNWLDPNKLSDQEAKRTPGDRSVPEPSGPQVTGESAAAAQVPMFDESGGTPEDTPPLPEDAPPPQPENDRDAAEGPTEDSRSD